MTARLLLLLTMTTVLCACEPDTFIPLDEFGGPAGVITGTVTYSGPPPCTEGGHIVGAAIVLGFDENLLPPPEGLATVPSALGVVSGDVLFAGIRAALAFAPDGARVCAPAGASSVAVSANFEAGPLPAGVYQLRGFYDHDGDFNPAFSISNLPTAGDIGGGAVENPEEVLRGGIPRYRRISLGEPDENGRLVIPQTGALVQGVAMSLGLTLELERPVFHLREVLDEAYGNTVAETVVVPADYQLDTFDPLDPVATEASFVRLVLAASVPPAEAAAAAASPFRFPTDGAFLFATRQDVDQNGVIDASDHIPESDSIPSLFPQVVLSRIDGAPAPLVVMQALTLRDNLLVTATTPADLAEQRVTVTAALRPAAACIDVTDPVKPGAVVNAHATDAQGTPLVADPAALEAALTEQFGRPMQLAVGCLPEGSYALNLVYPTGQAWTVPNEAGVCGEDEVLSADGVSCGSRPRLASQAVTVRIGPPRDPGYCAANPLPEACLP